MIRIGPDPEFSGASKAKPARGPSKARWLILLGLLVPFTGLTYLAVGSGSPGDRRERPVVLATMATIAGPFVGAIARHGQGCCVRASTEIATACGPILALGLIAQVVPYPFRHGRQATRLGLWTLGWLAWLGGGTASLLHALG